MSDFALAIPVILAHEGGPQYTNNQADPGGPTKYGLSLNRFWLGKDREDFPQLGVKLSFHAPTTAEQVQNLSRAQAIETYRLCWWDYWGYGRVDDQRVATKVFDLAINMRRPVAHQLAQRAANDCGASLSVDGIFGDKTVGAINSTEANEYLRALCHEQLARYEVLIANNPRLEQFRAGWTARAAWPFHHVTTMEPSA